MRRSRKSQKSQPPPSNRILHARSLPSATPYRVAVALFVCSALGMIVAVTAMAHLVVHPSRTAAWIVLGGMAFSIVMWIIAFFKRRSIHCPLCKGTPLLNSGARTHARAKRVFPLNHGLTATFSILATQRFRCMYCGSDFDLLKPPTRLLKGTETETAAAQGKPS